MHFDYSSYYSLVLVLQGICLWHAYKNNELQKWWWLIIFLPVVGSIVYLFIHFFTKRNIHNVALGMKELVNSNYKVEQLEKESKFTDTVSMKMKLADEYVHKERYKDAIQLYESCLNGLFAEDPKLLLKLVRTHYLDGNFAFAVKYGDKLQSEKTFKQSEERIGYAWSLYKQGQPEAAEKIFQEMDVKFANYRHRMEYSKYLNETGRKQEASRKLSELLEELSHMDSFERKLKRQVHGEIKTLFNKIA